MFGTGLIFVCLAFAGPQPEMPSDLHELNARDIQIPVMVAEASRDKIERISVFVSEDQGKTWKLLKEVGPNIQNVYFHAPRDGLYYFALQTLGKDKKVYPPQLAVDLK